MVGKAPAPVDRKTLKGTSLKRSDITDIFLRSLLVASSVNIRRMQNMGIAFALIPLIRHRGLEGTALVSFLKRHLQYFSTNIHMASPIIGVLARLEEENLPSGDPAPVMQMRAGLAGPYAAMGDAFFWGGLRPLASVCAAGTALFGLFIAPVLFLAVYIPLSLYIRIGGFVQGYRGIKQQTVFIKMLNMPTRAGYLRRATQVMGGFLLACWASLAVDIPLMSFAGLTLVICMVGMFVLYVIALGRSMPLAVILYGTTAVSYLISM
ncbi:MAG: PTS system mannose/fructose/sorbose family transporter subunit IID [Syntrophales bacterium]|nr:PTS system mannose/fructose/sorbose family transporter subunit IID [Syntrophales bacterium]